MAEINKQFLIFEEIEIDMAGVVWFDGDMCAVLGAILYHLSRSMLHGEIKLINIQPAVERLLSKNGFLSHYGREKIPDQWGTTIPYQRFDTKDDRYFADYIENKLIHHSEMPILSADLLKKFRESIFEIFSNAVLHSGTQWGIFSCGQFFPKRHQLDFIVADLGIGMRQNIQDKIGLSLSAEAAIDWATQGRNTTKHGKIPGGLGLKLLSEFIDLNGGCIQIVSDSGYWRRERSKTVTTPLHDSFSGTVVAVTINTADTNSYRLMTELSPADIF